MLGITDVKPVTEQDTDLSVHAPEIVPVTHSELDFRVAWAGAVDSEVVGPVPLVVVVVDRKVFKHEGVPAGTPGSCHVQ